MLPLDEFIKTQTSLSNLDTHIQQRAPPQYTSYL